MGKIDNGRFGQVGFFVPGIPATSGSKIPGVSKNGRRFVRPANKRQRSWQDHVRQCAVEAAEKARADGVDLPFDGPVSLKVAFTLPRPKSHYRTGRFAGTLKDSAPLWHIKKPDLSKMIRAVEDAIIHVWVRDDAQIASLRNCVKTYPVARDDAIGAWIQILPIELGA